MEKKNLTSFTDYLEEQGKSRNTISTYLSALKVYFAAYDEMNQENLKEYRETIETLKESSRHNRVVAINTYLEYINRPEWKLEKIKVLESETCGDILTMDEYNNLLDSLKRDNQLKVYWMIVFITKTGMKSGELVKLKKEDLANGDVEIDGKKIIIPQSIIEESREYFSNVTGDYLFTNRFGNAFESRAVTKEIHRVCEKYGIEKSKLTAQRLRDFFAINFAINNNDPMLLKGILGHSKLSTTAKYFSKSEYEREVIEEAVDW